MICELGLPPFCVVPFVCQGSISQIEKTTQKKRKISKKNNFLSVSFFFKAYHFVAYYWDDVECCVVVVVGWRRPLDGSGAPGA